MLFKNGGVIEMNSLCKEQEEGGFEFDSYV